MHESELPLQTYPIPSWLNLALLIGASLSSAAMLYGASHADSGWSVIAFAIGFSFTANTLFSLLHEAVHGLFCERKTFNDWAGRWASAWFPTGFSMQRCFHLTHHRNNRSAAEQFDVLHPGDNKWLKYAQWYAILTGIYWAIAVLGTLAYVLVPQTLRKHMLQLAGSQATQQTSAQPYVNALDGLDPLTSRLEVITSVGLQAVLIWVLELSALGWLACYGAFALSWSSLQYMDHAFSPLDARQGAWNLRVNPIVRAFFLNYHFHLAHHERPSMPWLYLGTESVAGPRFIDVWLQSWRGPRPVAGFPQFNVGSSAPSNDWGCPTGADSRAALIFCTALMAIFIVFYGTASAISGLIPWRIEVAFSFEQHIPFWHQWSLVYLSMIPMLLLLPFARRHWQALFPVFAALVIQTVIASCAFVLFPVQTNFPPREVSGAWAGFFFFADAINLERNFFPSLHVAFAFTAATALSSAVGRTGRILFFSWAFAIAASTMLIHEHRLIDVIAGALLAVFVWRMVRPWAARADVSEAVDIELLCLYNAWQFTRRHRRYGLIAFVLILDRMPKWRQRRVLTTGFCFLQAVDDLMDGDRKSIRDPLVVVDELMHAIRADTFGDNDLMRLAKAFVSDLRRVGAAASIEDVLALMAVMRQDRCRATEHTLWEAEVLRTHHHKTFSLSLNLLLAARGSALRAIDAPGLIEAFGWCSTMRDLREDINAGLINIPAGVLRMAQIDGANPFQLEQIIGNKAVLAWMKTGRKHAVEQLAATRAQLDTLGTQPGVEVLRLFTRSIQGFEKRRFESLYPTVKFIAPA
jgi:fatty acid desaturase/membrane-associated phospholipid phosphatase/phytoene/squalene synthetase